MVAGVPDNETVAGGDVVPVPPEPEPLVPEPEPLVPEPAVPEPEPAVVLPLLPAVVLPVVVPEALVVIFVLEVTPALPAPPHPPSATETSTIIVPENKRRDINVRMAAPRPGTIPQT